MTETGQEYMETLRKQIAAAFDQIPEGETLVEMTASTYARATAESFTDLTSRVQINTMEVRVETVHIDTSVSCRSSNGSLLASVARSYVVIYSVSGLSYRLHMVDETRVL